MYSLLVAIVGTTPATVQFGKLLDKVKGSGGSKKSGSFATVWESEFWKQSHSISCKITMMALIF